MRGLGGLSKYENGHQKSDIPFIAQKKTMRGLRGKPQDSVTAAHRYMWAYTYIAVRRFLKPLAAGYAERFVWKVLHFVKMGTTNGRFQTIFLDASLRRGMRESVAFC